METIIFTIILMIFLTWAHKALTKTVNSNSAINSTTVANEQHNNTYTYHDAINVNDTKFTKFINFTKYLMIKLSLVKKILLTAIIFLGCYYFVTYHAWLHSSVHTIRSNAQLNAHDDAEHNANNQDGDKGKEANPNTNNFIEIITPNKIKTKFADVAGMTEVKEEVQDIIKFLQSPAEFSRLGAKAPKGLLMYGPPGTGKTLLARAMAGESNVTFISVSGAQFEEEYVGVGASRVRQLFMLARNQAPCIIFIDEIDAVAFKRNSGKNAPWLAQTVNQLLTEMDGLNETKNLGIVVLASTNRMDVLDPAILRPGRFDRQVKLELPTLTERQAILQVHLAKIKLDPIVEPLRLARMTIGFSGADLANFVNEAAIHATKENKPAINNADFDYAKDRLVLGTKREAVQMSEHERKITAYHEAGHTLVSLGLSEHEPLYKVTISPRGMSLGHTAYQPEIEKYSHSKRYIEQSIAASLGGRVAEQLVFGDYDITTGAENDFQHATDLAFKMVTKWGFSKRLKTLNDPQMRLVSKEIIEKEIQEILDRNYKIAQEILEKNLDKLHLLANALLEKETLEAEEVTKIISGKPVPGHL